jgi:hypothetical protein
MPLQVQKMRERIRGQSRYRITFELGTDTDPIFKSIIEIIEVACLG